MMGKMIAWGCLLSLGLLAMACEQCRFCEAQILEQQQGQWVEAEVTDLREYCDELLEEVLQSPADTLLRLDNGDTIRQVYVWSCL